MFTQRSSASVTFRNTESVSVPAPTPVPAPLDVLGTESPNAPRYKISRVGARFKTATRLEAGMGVEVRQSFVSWGKGESSGICLMVVKEMSRVVKFGQREKRRARSPSFTFVRRSLRERRAGKVGSIAGSGCSAWYDLMRVETHPGICAAKVRRRFTHGDNNLLALECQLFSGPEVPNMLGARIGSIGVWRQYSSC